MTLSGRCADHNRRFAAVDLGQRAAFASVDDLRMARIDEEPKPDKEASEKLPPAADLLRVVEAYAAELRQFLHKLRKRLH